MKRLVIFLALSLFGTTSAGAEGLPERIGTYFESGIPVDLSDDEQETVGAVQGIYQARRMLPLWVDETGAGAVWWQRAYDPSSKDRWL